MEYLILILVAVIFILSGLLVTTVKFYKKMIKLNLKHERERTYHLVYRKFHELDDLEDFSAFLVDMVNSEK